MAMKERHIKIKSYSSVPTFSIFADFMRACGCNRPWQFEKLSPDEIKKQGLGETHVIAFCHPKGDYSRESYFAFEFECYKTKNGNFVSMFEIKYDNKFELSLNDIKAKLFLLNNEPGLVWV